VAAHGSISQDRNGKPNGLIGMAVDISRRKCAEEALRDACEDLEDKVEERTSELKKTLRSLKFQVANRNKAEASMRALSLRLLRTQDEERRMIARNLHDSTGQTLSLLKSNASLLKNSADADGKTLQQLQELCDLADQALVEIRTMSYLLHPPLLDELGLISAIQWYIEGFSKRSGIQVNLDLQDRKKRLPALVETALFRVLQECLTNTFRHSASKSVDIRLHIRRDDIMMSVRDYGKGISPEILRTLESTSLSGGVGLPGMRERVRELGGRIQIQSDCAGTCITVLISAVKLSVSESRKPTGFHGGAKPTNFQA
jgi:signal transduction histidine kinase